MLRAILSASCLSLAAAPVLSQGFEFGSSFDRSVREEELLSFMQLEASGELPAGRLVMPQLRGPVLLSYPSPDILVLASPMGTPEFFARCS